MLSLLLTATIQLWAPEKPIDVCCDEVQINHVYDSMHKLRLDQLLIINYSKEYRRFLVDEWIRLEDCRDKSDVAHKKAWEDEQEELIATLRNEMSRVAWREGREYPGKFIYERINIDKPGERWVIRIKTNGYHYRLLTKKLTVRKTAFDREWEERDVRKASARTGLPKPPILAKEVEFSMLLQPADERPDFIGPRR